MSTATPGKPDLNRIELLTRPPPHPQTHFIPGDTITGSVTIHKPHEASQLGASISLVGIARVKFKEKGRLFSQDATHECELVRIHSRDLTRVANDDQISWTFNIPLPPTTQPTRSNQFDSSAQGNQDFASNIGHPLPPTFGGGLTDDFMHLPKAESPEKNVTIVYNIHAVFDKPFHTHPYKGPLSCSTTISVSTLPSPDANLQKQHVVASDMPLPRNHLPGTPQQVPNPNLTLQTCLPSTLPSSSANMDIKLRLSHSIPDYLTDKLPPVTMQSFAVTLHSDTLLRVPTTSNSSIWPRETLVRFAQSYQLAHLPPISARDDPSGDSESELHNRSILLAGPTELAEWHLADLLPALRSLDVAETPSFKTFTVARTYQLQLKCDLVYESQKLSFEVARPLVVISPDVGGRMPSGADASHLLGEAEGAHAPDDNDAPPPYRYEAMPSPSGAGFEISRDAQERELPNYERSI